MFLKRVIKYIIMDPAILILLVKVPLVEFCGNQNHFTPVVGGRKYTIKM